MSGHPPPALALREVGFLGMAGRGQDEGLGGERRAFLSSLLAFFPARLYVSSWDPPWCFWDALGLYYCTCTWCFDNLLCIYLKLIITDDTPVVLTRRHRFHLY